MGNAEYMGSIMSTTCVNERLPLKNTVKESIHRNDDLATKKKKQKTGYGIISLSVVAAMFLVVALISFVFPGAGGGGAAAVAVFGETTSSLLRTSEGSTSTSNHEQGCHYRGQDIKNGERFVFVLTDETKSCECNDGKWMNCY